MANIIIKDDDRRAGESKTLKVYGVNLGTANAQQHEWAEAINARVGEFEDKINRRK